MAHADDKSPDLQTFVKETLVSIIRAIEEAQIDTAGTGAAINPIVDNKERARQPNGRGVDDVRFDIAVAAGKERNAGGKFIIKVISVEGGGRDANSNASRVSFSIPVSWPPAEKP